MVFFYLQKARKGKSIALGVQGVNRRAITKGRQASTHKEKEGGGETDGLSDKGIKKRAAGTKWTVPMMLRLLQGDKSE